MPHPSDPIITFDIPCRHCRYNLKGLPRQGRCPECGNAVRDSARDDLFINADPAWLRRILRGVNLLILGLIGTMVVVPLIPVVLNVFVRPAGIRPEWALALAGCVVCIFLVLAAAGSWLMASPEPGAKAPGPDAAPGVMSVMGSTGPAAVASRISPLYNFIVSALVVGSALLLTTSLFAGALRFRDPWLIEFAMILGLAGIVFSWWVWSLYIGVDTAALLDRVPDDRAAAYAISLQLATLLLNLFCIIFIIGPFLSMAIHVACLYRLRRGLKHILAQQATLPHPPP